MSKVIAKGVDVSHFQNDRGDIDFNRVKNAGYDFAIIKATEGSEDGSAYVDPFFKSNVDKANAAGLATHAYHFFRAVSVNDARNEAKWFIKALKTVDVKGYVFCDVELKSLTYNKAALTDYVNAFGDELAAAGYTKFGVYSGKVFFEDRLIEDKLMNHPLLWLARYNWFLGHNADVWQYSSTTFVDGIVGHVDVNKAYTDAVLNKDVAPAKPVSKPESKPVSKPVSKPAPKPAAKPQVSGKDSVKEIQKLLNKFGYKLVVDGVAGAKTTSAIKDFQKKHKLAVDGVVGKNTMAALTKQPSKPKPKVSAKGSAVVPFKGVLKKGSRGDEVKRVQNALHITADGVFGANTEKAVKDYQKRHGLSSDGIVGVNTWNTLF